VEHTSSRRLLPHVYSAPISASNEIHWREMRVASFPHPTCRPERAYCTVGGAPVLTSSRELEWEASARRVLQEPYRRRRGFDVNVVYVLQCYRSVISGKPYLNLNPKRGLLEFLWISARVLAREGCIYHGTRIKVFARRGRACHKLSTNQNDSRGKL
jgi:hypothetical protein